MSEPNDRDRELAHVLAHYLTPYGFQILEAILATARDEGRRDERARIIHFVEKFGMDLDFQRARNPFHDGRRDAAREIERWLKTV